MSISFWKKMEFFQKYNSRWQPNNLWNNLIYQVQISTNIKKTFSKLDTLSTNFVDAQKNSEPALFYLFLRIREKSENIFNTR